jgi:hypothetical protein
VDQIIQYGVAIAIGLSIFMIGRWGVRVLVTGGPPDVDPDSIVDVQIDYECSVCGMRLTVTQAQDEDVTSPRHCMEQMERVTPAPGL